MKETETKKDIEELRERKNFETKVEIYNSHRAATKESLIDHQIKTLDSYRNFYGNTI